MMKYQLSQRYHLTTADDIADGETSLTIQLKQGELYGLLDTASGECLVINSTMHLFLKQYETAKTRDEIVAFFAHEFGSTPKEVLPIVQAFFKEMKQRGVIMPPQKVERMEITAPHTLGTRIDHYRIEENLSTNLPLEVYKATDVRNEQLVILKMLRMPTRLPKKQKEEWRELFKKEFEIQKILRGSPTICQLLDLTPDYAVLEWFESTSLRRRLADDKGINEALREKLLLQILDSYCFIHNEKILHGDVHARNILLSENNEIKIIDFDLAHHLKNKTDFPPVRGGAPEFIPPENVKFDAFEIVQGTANYQTEVYQLGIIAYWMVYGKVPFSGDTWQELGNNILNKTIDFPLTNTQGEKITLGMRLFLKKCLAKNPQNRFASAKEMRDDFSVIVLENMVLVTA